MVQMDGPKRHVYIKFRDNNRLLGVLHLTGGQAEYRHTKWGNIDLRLETAGLGMRKVRIANLPPEVPDAVIRTVLSSYREVQGVQAETWSRAYRYTVANGIRIASVTLTKHIPSHITMAGNRVLVSYEGQPMTFYGCKRTGHLYQACPMRWRTERKATAKQATSWVDVAANGAGGSRKDREVAENGAQHIIPTEHAEKIYAEVSEDLSDDRRLPQEDEQELLNNTIGEETCSSETSVTKASAEVVYTHEEEDQMECGTLQQEKETDDTRRTTQITQQQERKQDIQSEGKDRGRGDEVVETDVWIAESTPTHSDEETRTAAQLPRPKRSKKLKVERRGSPPRDRSRHRVINMFKKD